MYFFPNFDPVRCSMSGSNCCFLTCIQVSQEAGKLVWFPSMSFPVCHDPHKDIVSEAKVDVFLEFPCFFYDPADVGNLFSGSSAFTKSSLYIWKILVHLLLKPSLKDFEHSCQHVKWVQLCDSFSILWRCPSFELEWKLTFSSPVATAEFSKFAGILSAALYQHHLLEFEIAQLEFCNLH